MLCAIITGPTYEQAHKQMEAASDLYELRLDYFDTLDLPKISALLKKPCIITLRSPAEGGKFRGSEEERQKKLLELAALNPAYIDIESTVPLAKKIPNLIISYHQFDHTPDLDALWTKLTKTPAAYYKIATMANSSLDSWRMLEFVKAHKNCIGFCLGEKGSFSRILGPLYGSPITYACLEEPTAPGQIPLSELKKLSLTPDTKLFGLIGDPLTNSSSPAFHNQNFREWRLNAVYVKMPFQASELPQFLPRLLSFSGLSVTMPLKESIIPYLDRLDPEAAEIGAVNTIVIKEGKTIGYNTDGKGALDAIEQHTPVKGKSLTLLGAGGAARAILYEAKKRGARVSLFNRTKEKAVTLASHFGVQAIDALQPCDILVNSTPADFPLEGILPGTFVMDIRSYPRLTPFLEKAAEKNCHLIYGSEMFYHQALGQYRLWGIGEGGCPPPEAF